MSATDWLAELGLHVLPPAAAEARALDERGFVVVPDALDPSAVSALRASFEDVAGDSDTTGTRHAPGHLACLDARFDDLLVHPRALGLVAHVLRRPFQVLGFGLRDPRPGYGAQALHTDWLSRVAGAEPAVVTCLWLLDPFTAESGATRVVPGTHREARAVPKDLTVHGRVHPREELVLAPAGALLAFDGHLWHGGSANAGEGPRRVVQCQWVASELARPDRGDVEPPPRASRALRALLGRTQD